jgi:hypothetical protein
VLIATIVVLGEGVVWYSGQFWALYFLQQVTKIDARRGDLGVFLLLCQRIFQIAVPVDASHAVCEVDGQRNVRVTDKARLAGGRVRLSGLPVLSLDLDDGRFVVPQHIGAALRGDGLLHELGARLRGRRLGRRRAKQQRDGRYDDTQHEFPRTAPMDVNRTCDMVALLIGIL